MIDIFTQLENLSPLSSNQKRLVSFILKNPDQFLQMNVKEISETCFVSSSTIYRLCDKLHLSGLSDLRVKLSSSLNQYLQKDQFDYDYPIKKHQTHYEIIQTIKEDYDKTIQTTSGLFSLTELKKIVSAMLKAKTIDIYTSAGHIFFAENFKFQMKEIGVNVNVPIEEYYQRLTAASSDSNHLAFVISFAGRGLLNTSIFSILKEKKTPIVLIGSQEYIDKQKECDYRLYMAADENHYNKISSFATRQSLLYILDVLYTCYFEYDYQNNVNKKLDYYHSIIKK